MHPGQRVALRALPDHVHLVRVRAQHPHDGAIGVRVRAQNRVRIMVRPAEQTLDGRRVWLPGIDPRMVDRPFLVTIHVRTLLAADMATPARDRGQPGSMAWPPASALASDGAVAETTGNDGQTRRAATAAMRRVMSFEVVLVRTGRRSRYAHRARCVWRHRPSRWR